MPGVVAVIQTFGDRIYFHPHIHVLVTEDRICLKLDGLEVSVDLHLFSRR